MIRILLIFILVSHGWKQPVFGQYKKLKEISTHSGFLSSDHEHNLYYTANDSLFKLTPPYDSVFSLSMKDYGSPIFIDVSNPKKTLLLFDVSGELLMLDSELNKLLGFYLEEFGFSEISAVVSSQDRSLWFYNHYHNILRKLNNNFIPITEIIDLNSYFTAPGPGVFMVSHNLYLYINMPSSGILVLDQKGNFITTYPLYGLPDFQVLNQYIYYYRDSLLHRFNKNNMKSRSFLLPETEDIINTLYLEDYLAIQTKNKIIIYAIDNLEEMKFLENKLSY